MPLAWLGDVASLEGRLSRLEDTDSQSQVQQSHDISSLESRIFRLENASTQLGGQQTQEMASIETRISRLEDASAQPGSQQSSMTGTRQVELISPRHRVTQDQLRRVSLVPGVDGASDFARSSPAIGLLATFARSAAEEDSSTSTFSTKTDEAIGILDLPQQDALFEIYRDRVHCRYPFLQLRELQDAKKRPTGFWVGYFINMIFSISLLLEKNKHFDASQHSHQAYHRVAVTKYLSHVFAQPERLLHIQAYLLLAMHAIYSPSTEKIISIASATMRYCVMAQFHLAEAEPEPIDIATKIYIQMRRLVFWSAYSLDRAVGTAFDLPFSVPDYQITVKMFANVNDSELDEGHYGVSLADSHSRPRFTNVSFALHMVYCRQIQSEILNITLHRDFGKQFDRLPHWRLKVLGKLDRWKSMCYRHSDSHSETLTSAEWLHMIYAYSLAMLYQPTKATVTGPAGDWTVKSCVQACLIFRKFQREIPISELWLGLIVQFKCGVALLYCFFATPPDSRSEAYELPSASEAVRACSIILSILAERWSQARCVRDAFDILSREIPLHDSVKLQPRKMSQESSETLLKLMPLLDTVIVHRNTLRMIREMALEEFPRPRLDGAVPAEQSSNIHPDGDSPTLRTSITGDMFQPSTPYFSQVDMSAFDTETFDYLAMGFPGEFDPQFSFTDV